MKKQYNNQELAALCQQLSYLYSSGTSLDKGFELLKNLNIYDLNAWQKSFYENPQLSYVFKEDGGFPIFFIEALEIAEKVGQEEKLLNEMTSHFKRQSELKQFLKESLSLPLILLAIFGIILSLMAWSILPIFQRLFIQLGISQSASLSAFLYALKGFSVGLMIIYVLVFVWFALGEVKHKNDSANNPSWETRLLRLFPKAYESTQLAYYTSMAHMAMSGGIDNKAALEMVKANDISEKFEIKLKQAKSNLDASEGLYELLLNNKLYEPLDLSTLNIAAKAGQLEKALEDLAIHLNQKAQDQLNSSLNRIEPWLITLLTAMVFAIVFSMILPLLNVMSSLG